MTETSTAVDRTMDERMEHALDQRTEDVTELVDAEDLDVDAAGIDVDI